MHENEPFVTRAPHLAEFKSRIERSVEDRCLKMPLQEPHSLNVLALKS